MIQGIRRKFILIALAVLSAAMIVLTAVINISNRIIVEGELRETLESLSEADDRGPQKKNKKGGRERRVQNAMYEARYFVVRLEGTEGYNITDSSRASGSTAEEQDEIVREALASGADTGMAGSYLYQIRDEGRGRTAVFLNCETKMDSLRRLLLISVIACAGGILVAWFLVFLFSKRAMPCSRHSS